MSKKDNIDLQLHLLRSKHKQLCQEVEVLQRQPGVCQCAVTELKKQKLKLKDKIERLERRLTAGQETATTTQLAAE